MKEMKLNVVLEKGPDALWGRVELPGSLLTTCGDTLEEVSGNLRELIEDYFAHDAPELMQKPEIVEFNYRYDLTALFEEFNVLNFASVAEKAGIEPAAMQQFVDGEAYPNADEVKRIEAAIHEVGQSLMQVSLG